MNDEGQALEAGDWVGSLGGVGQVVDVRVMYFEEWQAIPDGNVVGDYWRTSVTVKLVFDSDVKPRKRLGWETCDSSLCRAVSEAQQKKVDACLGRDAKFAKKVDAYRIKNWSSITNRYCVATEDEWQEVIRVLGANAETIEAGVTFQDVVELLKRDANYDLRLSTTPTSNMLQLCVRLDSPQEPPRVFRQARAWVVQR